MCIYIYIHNVNSLPTQHKSGQGRRPGPRAAAQVRTGAAKAFQREPTRDPEERQNHRLAAKLSKQAPKHYLESGVP
jgi:hypothetical protein